MSETTTAHELEPARVRKLIAEGAQVVDVRTEDEREAARVPGSIHIPLERLQESADRLDRDRPVVFYCRGGDRSRLAADAFAASGWDAATMAGGIAAWKEQGLPLEPEDGEVRAPSGLPPR